MAEEIEPQFQLGVEPNGASGVAPQGGFAVAPNDDLEVDARADDGFDMVAAQLRSDASDTETFFKVLASKLSDALGERVKLERAGGLLKRDRAVSGLELDLTSAGAGTVFAARRERGGSVACTVARRVRGIVLSTKEVPMSEWVDELVAALGEEAKRSEQTWKALHGLVS